VVSPPLDVLAGISYDPPLTDPFLLKNNWKIAYRIQGKRVKDFFKVCVSKVKMSPITAELKCPHERGKDTIESEAAPEVASHEDGGGREDHLEGGRGEDRCVLPAG
jgi:hypothetical protein